MVLSEAPGFLSKFRRTPWKFQQTFHTPLKNLCPFVKTIVTAAQLIEGCLTIDSWVFEPKHLVDLFASHSIPLQFQHELTLTANREGEVEALLQAVFADWIDFIFIPKPKSFAVYADHDEYTTFFAHTRSGLNRVALPLADQGFEIIEGYRRYF